MKSSTPVSAAASLTVRTKSAKPHLAIDDHGEKEPVNDRKGRDLGWRCESREGFRRAEMPGIKIGGTIAPRPARATERSGARGRRGARRRDARGQ